MYVCLLTCLLVVCNASLPNIIFFLTDDQDQTLGGSFPTTAANGATPMPKAQELLVNQGAQATQFVIHTPICCPSRATTWTGRYLHNVKQPVSQGECGDAYAGQDTEGNPCCMHVDEVLVNNFTVARYLKEKAGYATILKTETETFEFPKIFQMAVSANDEENNNRTNSTAAYCRFVALPSFRVNSFSINVFIP